MRLIGLMPVRNEQYCLGLTARAALMWCDELVMYMHACTDHSHDIAFELQLQPETKGRVHIVIQRSETWHEMVHRQTMLLEARKHGATHIALIDSDELLTGNLVERKKREGYGAWQEIRAMIGPLGLPPGHILSIPGYNLRNGINQYHSNGVWGNRWFSTAFVDEPILHWGGDKFHQREPMGRPMADYKPISQGKGGVMHLWGASERRLKAKHALYKVTEWIRWPERRPKAKVDEEYSWSIKGGYFKTGDTPADWTYAPVPESWWTPYAHLMQYLDVDAEPWQEAEVRRLIAEHGREKFVGLDLFGVA